MLTREEGQLKMYEVLISTLNVPCKNNRHQWKYSFQAILSEIFVGILYSQYVWEIINILPTELTRQFSCYISICIYKIYIIHNFWC